VMGTTLLNDNMSYRPLPSCVTIKPSNVDGLGLFAREYVAAGKILGITHYNLDRIGIIRTPLGGFINHSDTPNCELVFETLGGRGCYSLATLQDLSKGDELTIKYQHFNSFRP